MTLVHLVPEWPAPPGVHAVFTRRGRSAADGDSTARYRYLNLGDHVNDAAAAVAQNRSRLQQVLQARPVFLQQVHGCGVVELQQDTPDGTVADAAMTGARQLACTVLVADCLPVLLATANGAAVAAAHAGWRGLAAGVLEHTLAQLRQLPAAAGQAVMAWLGPCIGPAAFEVGAEVRAAFVAADAAAGAHFESRGRGKYLAHLPALARQRLVAAGVVAVYGNDGTSAWCTVTNEQAYYSHRRDHSRYGGTGRMAACIWRT